MHGPRYARPGKLEQEVTSPHQQKVVVRMYCWKWRKVGRLQGGRSALSRLSMNIERLYVHWQASRGWEAPERAKVADWELPERCRRRPSQQGRPESHALCLPGRHGHGRTSQRLSTGWTSEEYADFLFSLAC